MDFNQTLQNQNGFTLLETMIAVAIMVVAFGSVLMIESGALKTAEKSKQMNIVAMLAKSKMTETEVYIESKTFNEVKDEESGEFEEPYQDYKWSRKIKEVEFPQINFGASNQDGDNKVTTTQETLSKLMSNYLSKAIREVTITITWQRGKGTQNFSLSTYWVNLNHEFSFSE